MELKELDLQKLIDEVQAKRPYLRSEIIERAVELASATYLKRILGIVINAGCSERAIEAAFLGSPRT